MVQEAIEQSRQRRGTNTSSTPFADVIRMSNTSFHQAPPRRASVREGPCKAADHGLATDVEWKAISVVCRRPRNFGVRSFRFRSEAIAEGRGVSRENNGSRASASKVLRRKSTEICLQRGLRLCWGKDSKWANVCVNHGSEWCHNCSNSRQASSCAWIKIWYSFKSNCCWPDIDNGPKQSTFWNRVLKNQNIAGNVPALALGRRPDHCEEEKMLTT